MKRIKRPFYRARVLLSTVRLLPHILLLLFADPSGVVKADLARWAYNSRLPVPRKSYEFIILFIKIMTFTQEFRNVFCLRLGTKAKIINWLCPRLETLQIGADYIGPGLFIEHGVGSLISADSIGRNCWINQQVTIGYSNDTDRPTIGDNVKVSPGAVILGKVKIGDNATVGPNTFVMSDVPPGATVLGVPGKIIWLKDLKNLKPS